MPTVRCTARADAAGGERRWRWHPQPYTGRSEHERRAGHQQPVQRHLRRVLGAGPVRPPTQPARPALEQYFASEAAQRSTQISLIASVAKLTLQADQALLQVTRDTLKTYEESLGLTQRSFDVGVASALELRQARSAVTVRG